MVTFGSTSETSTEMRKYTRDLYARLEAETGLATGFSAGRVHRGRRDEDRLEEYRRVSAFNRCCGVDVQEISPREVGELFPLARTDDLLAGFYVADDGRANPVDVTMSMARGRADGRGEDQRRGARAGRPHRTRRGDRRTDSDWRRRVRGRRQLRRHVGPPARGAQRRDGAVAGRRALLPADRGDPGISRDWPVLEDPASFGYFREEGGGLLLGLFEAVCAPWQWAGSRTTSRSASCHRTGTGWVRISRRRWAASRSRRDRHHEVLLRPESFTPDLQPVVGEAPEVRNYFVAPG
jgi:4-methylaminobutanoate oxidase (formaldehyde-forming)